jgi:hypothetical protein
MRRIRLVVFSCVVCLLATANTSGGKVADSPPAESPMYVSVLQLITTPEKFDHKLVSLVGFLTIEREGDKLFAHQEDALNSILANAIQVEGTKEMFYDRERIDMKYVKILGTFQASDHKRIPFYSGIIVGVRSCGYWSDPAHPLQQKIRELPQ